MLGEALQRRYLRLGRYNGVLMYQPIYAQLPLFNPWIVAVAGSNTTRLRGKPKSS